MNILDKNKSWALKQGSHIAIIGAGPAGCFFALHAIRMIKQYNLDIKLTIFDAKNFLLTGPPGCNLCIGVISQNLVRILEKTGIKLHSSKIQREIKGYYFQTGLGGVQLQSPKEISSIFSVFRGNGPRYSSPDGNVSFDDMLLQKVIDQGVQHQPEQVINFTLPNNFENPATLITRSEGTEKQYTADLIVGAFGLHSPLLTKLTNLDFGYLAPKITPTVMCELPLEQKWIDDRFGDNIVVFSFPSKTTRYVIVVPKKSHLSISIINRGNATHDDLNNFLQSSIFSSYLPEDFKLSPQYCYCHPQIALSSARKPFANRLVLVGDASYTRIYKNGIESAYYTSLYAAKTALRRGVSKWHFFRHYSLPMQKLFVIDNLWGRLMFFIYDHILISNIFFSGFLRALLDVKKKRMNLYLHNLVWNMFTGSERYQKIFLQFINPPCQLFLLSNFLKNLWDKFSSNNKSGSMHTALSSKYLKRGKNE